MLKVMSASPGDPQPVFDLIARQAAKLCNVPIAAVASSTERIFAEQATIAITSAANLRALRDVRVTFRNRSNTRPPPATC